MRILVTGGNGSIGRELVPGLLRRGDEVAVLDRDLGALEGMSAPGLSLVRGGAESGGDVAGESVAARRPGPAASGGSRLPGPLTR